MPNEFINAIKNGDLETVKQIINFDNAIVNEPDERGEKPLYYAADKGFLPIVKYLVEHGANINDTDVNQGGYGITPLHVACLEEKNLPVAIYLAEHGGDLYLRNYSGLSPLDYINQEIFYGRDLPNNGEGIRNLEDIKNYYNDTKLGPLVIKRKQRKEFFKSDLYKKSIEEAYRPERLKARGDFNKLDFGKKRNNALKTVINEISYLRK